MLQETKPNCPLCTIPYFEARSLRYLDDLIYIADTKGRKGHDIRLMVCTRRHVIVPPREVLLHAERKIVEMGLKVFPEEFAVCYMTLATVKDHWHAILFDGKLNEMEREQLSRTEWRWIVRSHEPNEFNTGLRG